ncbi:MAG: hypothetical protein A2050_10045 [Candidatus Rokubacteria bacterium GWA2_73_35]|nr:MAG: hypothetical protein A2050_10045 [Candidatus Rokubacteria bacterium GWA2_73_35]
MTLMRIREITSCRNHGRTTIVLEDPAQELTLTFYADPEEARRLTREIARSGCACHPIYDFVQSLLLALDADVTRVVLEDVKGQGIGSRVYVRSGGDELGVPCYPPDALALALRAKVPIYATADALTHAQCVAPSADAGGGPCVADERREVTRWLERVQPTDFSSRAGREGS